MTELCAPPPLSCMRRSTSVGAVLDWDNLTRPSSLYEVFKALKEKECTENLTDQEIESKFTSLSLAFKTDKLTLTNRLDLQQRQRDIAEKNIDEEIKQLKSALESLNHLCVNVETRDAFQRLQQQVDVLHHASDRVSSAAEVYGAVQQEARISRAIDIMLLHVENVKRIHEREHAELEESRKILAEHNLSLDYGGSGSMMSLLGDPRSNPNRIRSVSVIHNPNGILSTNSANLSANSLDSPKLRRASASTFSQSKVSSNNENITSNQLTLSTPVNKLTRRVGIVTSSFRKTSSPSGNHLTANPINENLNGKETSLSCFSKEVSGGNEVRFMDDLNTSDDTNNNNKNSQFRFGRKESVKSNSNSSNNNNSTTSSNSTSNAQTKPKMRSRSLIEPVKEEDESLLLDEIDELAKKRDSSPAPPSFRNSVKNVRKTSFYKQLVQWYRDLYWPWDWEETILGLRYSLTGILLFAAFVSLIFTFFAGGQQQQQQHHQQQHQQQQHQQIPTRGEEL